MPPSKSLLARRTHSRRDAPASVLVHVGSDLIGDGLLKLPFLRCLRAAWPEARVTWVCGKGASIYTGPLAPAVTGLIDEVVENAGIGLSARELIGRKPLNGRRFDVIIDTQRGALATLALRRLPHDLLVSPALRYALSDRKPKAAQRSPDMLRQMLDLLELAVGRPIPTPADNLLTVDPALAAAAAEALPPGPVYIGLAPGAGGRHKCWPLERFAALARAQMEAGRMPVFLLGPAEADWADDLRAQVPQARFPLQDSALVKDHGLTPFAAVALGQRLAAAVVNDAGVGHLMAAAGPALVVLYGPTSPRKFAPLARRRHVITAQDHGGAAMSDIPLTAVAACLDTLLPLPAAEKTPAFQEDGSGLPVGVLGT